MRRASRTIGRCRRWLATRRNAGRCAALGKKRKSWRWSRNIEQQRGRFAEAEARYRAALALDSALPSAFNNLGLTLNALGRPPEAEDAFASAIRLYPEFAAAHSNRGNVRFRRGDLELAKADYETAIRLNPEYAEAYNNLGSVRFRLGDRVGAADAYRHALRLKPELEEVRRNLAVVEGAAGELALQGSNFFDRKSCPLPRREEQVARDRAATLHFRHAPLDHFDCRACLCERSGSRRHLRMA